MQVLLPPAQSGGSEASTRSLPSAPRRSIKAAEPKVKEHRDAARPRPKRAQSASAPPAPEGERLAAPFQCPSCANGTAKPWLSCLRNVVVMQAWQ